MGKILIADDEANILEVMIEVLEEAGHTVTGVRDGQAAIETMKAEPFDLVIVDVMMPRVDGYHVATAAHGIMKQPRIVIVTSRDYERDKKALHSAGVDAYLPKPFSNKDLVDVVSTLLKKGQ